ncbi:MAG: peptide chain release factor N(5)-glutamine methyltransferase [Bacteroidia bacterium]|nr:peptide chain release factor N(5)-glutamine methyltransferase [Bacteroidia bacterium]
MLLREIKNIYHLELDTIYPKEEVDSLFSLALSHYLKFDRFILALHPNLVISKEEEQPLFEVLAALKQHVPIQYILGETLFMEIPIKVGAGVLIPRPETEDLVRWILEDIPEDAKFTCLDVGTGSGAIAIALKKHRPKLDMHALDISKRAIEISQENAMIHKMEIHLLEYDILGENPLDLPLDIVVSNPPYVRELEQDSMAPNVLDHEPPEALFVSDDDPLVYYEAILKLCADNLAKGGFVYFEINEALGEEMTALLKKYSYSDIQLKKDIFEKPRMIKGRKS